MRNNCQHIVNNDLSLALASRRSGPVRLKTNTIPEDFGTMDPKFGDRKLVVFQSVFAATYKKL